MLKIADIVKYSLERIEDAFELHQQVEIPLEIQTLGSKGLKYKWISKTDMHDWITIPSFKVNDLKDSVGSGDWCTAGLIHLLGQDGKKGFDQCSQYDIEYAINFGQALASLNCYYEGARGGMYSLTRDHFKELVTLIINGQSPLKSIYDNDNYLKLSSEAFYCPTCDR